MAAREVLEGGVRGGSGTQKFVYQKWPDKIFPMVHFVFSHDDHFGLEGGGVQGVVAPPPPMVYGHSNTSLVPAHTLVAAPAAINACRFTAGWWLGIAHARPETARNRWMATDSSIGR